MLSESLAAIACAKKELERSGASKFALDKLQKCLESNPGWKKISQINGCLMEDSSSLPTGMTLKEDSSFKYAPISSVSVERSFSEFNAFMRSNRVSFAGESFAKHFMISFNSKLFDSYVEQEILAECFYV